MESKKALSEKMIKILKKLEQIYPMAKCELQYESPFQLLIATILSAQCTDKMVNKVTVELFQKFPTVISLAQADIKVVEKIIKPTGFFRNKAKSIIGCSQQLRDIYDAKVPANLDHLVALKGVGRKTANVVLGNAYAIPGLVVDTHVGRLSRRMGFTNIQDAVKVEFELQKITPKKKWTLLSHLFIFHGRNRCSARKPDCKNCEVESLCSKNYL